MGILSRLEGIFAPERLGKATPKASFESSSRDSRRRGILPGGRPTDQRRDLTGGNRMEMIKRSRYAHRNSGMSAEQRGMMAIYAIGSGRWPSSLAADMAWRDEAEALFIERVRKPEITGRFNWRETQSLISRALDRDGEIFAVKTRDLFDLPKVQLLETHAFSTTTDAERRIFDGIQYDGVGRPVFYFLVGADGKDIPLPASAVVHVFDADCSSMSRAIPLQQHGLLHIHDQLEMLASEKHAVKRLQQEAMVLKSNRERALDDGDFSLDSERAEIEAGTLTTDELEVAEAFGARVQRINTDETLEGFTFQRPHSGFMEFQTQLERDAAGGGLPWEVVRDPSRVGGASVRLVTSKAERYIAHRGGVIDERFNSEMWLYVIGDAINKRELSAVKGWSKVEWGAPKKLSVDAGRDSQAARLDVEVGLKTWAQEIEERGGDFDEWLAERSEQARRIMTAAGKPESEPIPLWMLYKPAGVSLSAAVEQDSTLSEE